MSKPLKKETYFISQIKKRIQYLSQAFKYIVYAQIKVSLINTCLTALVILIIFPILKIYLPLKNLLILITFIFGLFPIIGNLISNFIIILSSISVSITIGTIMILYLVLIHKLEYFLNAEIIGGKINAKPWELMLAMLVLESMFGIKGLIAAPIYYAYLKIELKKLKII